MPQPHVTLGNSAIDIGSGINSFAKGLMEQNQRSRQIALQEALAKSTMAKAQSDIDYQSKQGDYLGQQGDYLGKEGTHLDTQNNLLNAQTHGANAGTATIEQENLPADFDDEERLRAIEPDTPTGLFRGMTKKQAEDYIKVRASVKAAQDRGEGAQGRFENRPVMTYDKDGNLVILRPNLPSGPQATPMPGLRNPSVTNAQQHGQLGYDQNGNAMIVRPNQADAANTATPIEGVSKPLTSAERNFAGAGQAARSAHEDLTDWEQTHPETMNEIAKAIALPNFGRMVPGMGEGVSRTLQSFRLAGMSPEAQAYLKRMFDFAGVVGPKRYGLRGMQSEVTLQQLWTDFGLGQFDLSHKGVLAAEKNRENAVRQLEMAAGRRAWDASKGVFPQDTIPPVVPKPNRFFVKPPEKDLYDF